MVLALRERTGICYRHVLVGAQVSLSLFFFLAAQAAQDLRNSQTHKQTNKLTNKQTHSHLAKY